MEGESGGVKREEGSARLRAALKLQSAVASVNSAKILLGRSRLLTLRTLSSFLPKLLLEHLLEMPELEEHEPMEPDKMCFTDSVVVVFDLCSFTTLAEGLGDGRLTLTAVQKEEIPDPEEETPGSTTFLPGTLLESSWNPPQGEYTSANNSGYNTPAANSPRGGFSRTGYMTPSAGVPTPSGGLATPTGGLVTPSGSFTGWSSPMGSGRYSITGRSYTGQMMDDFGAHLLSARLLRLPHTRDKQASYGAEQLRKVLGVFFESLMDTILAHGGDVLRIAGDALITVFKPKPGCDTSKSEGEVLWRAARTGLSAICKLHGRCVQGWDMKVRGGMVDGTVDVYTLGSDFSGWHYIAAGEPFDFLETILNDAEPGEFVVTSAAWKRMNDTRAAQLAGGGVLGGFADDCHGTKLKSGNFSIFTIASEEEEVSPIEMEAYIEEQKDIDSQVANRQKYLEPIIRSFIPPPVLHAQETEVSGWFAEAHRVAVVFVNVSFKKMPNLQGMQAIFEVLQTCMCSVLGMIKEFSVDDKGTVMVGAVGLPPTSRSAEPSVLACSASLRMIFALENMGVTSYIGISTGPVFTGSIGNARREFCMFGDVVNTAARLMCAAKRDPLVQKHVLQFREELIKEASTSNSKGGMDAHAHIKTSRSKSETTATVNNLPKSSIFSTEKSPKKHENENNLTERSQRIQTSTSMSLAEESQSRTESFAEESQSRTESFAEEVDLSVDFSQKIDFNKRVGGGMDFSKTCILPKSLPSKDKSSLFFPPCIELDVDTDVHTSPTHEGVHIHVDNVHSNIENLHSSGVQFEHTAASSTEKKPVRSVSPLPKSLSIDIEPSLGVSSACHQSVILVDDTVTSTAKDRITFRLVGRIALKGKSNRRCVYLPIKESHHDYIMSIDSTPLIGRESVTAFLQERLTQLHTDSGGGLFLVQGFPGVGRKSVVRSVLREWRHKANIYGTDIEQERASDFCVWRSVIRDLIIRHRTKHPGKHSKFTTTTTPAPVSNSGAGTSNAPALTPPRIKIEGKPITRHERPLSDMSPSRPIVHNVTAHVTESVTDLDSSGMTVHSIPEAVKNMSATLKGQVTALKLMNSPMSSPLSPETSPVFSYNSHAHKPRSSLPPRWEGMGYNVPLTGAEEEERVMNMEIRKQDVYSFCKSIGLSGYIYEDAVEVVCDLVLTDPTNTSRTTTPRARSKVTKSAVQSKVGDQTTKNDISTAFFGAFEGGVGPFRRKSFSDALFRVLQAAHKHKKDLPTIFVLDGTLAMDDKSSALLSRCLNEMHTDVLVILLSLPLWKNRKRRTSSNTNSEDSSSSSDSMDDMDCPPSPPPPGTQIGSIITSAPPVPLPSPPPPSADSNLLKMNDSITRTVWGATAAFISAKKPSKRNSLATAKLVGVRALANATSNSADEFHRDVTADVTAGYNGGASGVGEAEYAARRVLQTIKLTLEQGVSVGSCFVSPLSLPATSVLAAQALNTTACVEGTAALTLHLRSGGFPGAVFEYCALIQSEGLAKLTEAGDWPYSTRANSVRVLCLTVPPLLERRALDLMASLSSQQLFVLKVLSVIGTFNLPVSLLEAIYPIAVHGRSLAAEVQTLASIGVLKLSNGANGRTCASFTNLLLHQVLYEKLSHEHRIQLHSSLSDHLAGLRRIADAALASAQTDNEDCEGPRSSRENSSGSSLATFHAVTAAQAALQLPIDLDDIIPTWIHNLTLAEKEQKAIVWVHLCGVPWLERWCLRSFGRFLTQFFPHLPEGARETAMKTRDLQILDPALQGALRAMAAIKSGQAVTTAANMFRRTVERRRSSNAQMSPSPSTTPPLITAIKSTLTLENEDSSGNAHIHMPIGKRRAAFSAPSDLMAAESVTSSSPPGSARGTITPESLSPFNTTVTLQSPPLTKSARLAKEALEGDD